MNRIDTYQTVVAALLAAVVFLAPHTSKANASGGVSPAVMEALVAGDLKSVVLAMREEKATPKTLYLMREASRIVGFEMEGKPPRPEAHQVYQNMAVSYHNLYLFLKFQGVDKEEYSKKAHHYYKKARSAATVLHKEECDLLDAALLAASGKFDEARKQFSKIDETLMRGDFESMEYVAAYHAAMGDVDLAISALDAAHRLNPQATMTWLAVGDDFHGIEADPRFKALMVSWKERESERKLVLSLPKASPPRLEVTDETGLFRPQKTMPRYVLKKRGKVKAIAHTKKKTAGKKTTVAGKSSSKGKVYSGKKVSPKKGGRRRR